MATNDSTADVQARILAGRLLSLGAGRASAALDQFSSWLLSGFGAAFALLFANIDVVSKHVAVTSLRTGLMLFLCALVAGVVAKFLSSIVSAGAEAAEQGGVIGRDLAAAQIEVNVKRMFEETERAFYWPMRILVASSFNKVSTGDFAAAGRLHTKIAQVQGIFVVSEVTLAAGSAMVLGCGLTV